MNAKFYDMGFNEVGGKVFFNEGVFSQYFHKLYKIINCNNKLFIYEDNFWKHVEEIELKKLCKSCFDSIEVGVWRLNYENKYIPTIKTDAVLIEEKMLNRYQYKINFQNGVYDFKTQKFEEHCEENYFSYIMDYELLGDRALTPHFDMLMDTLSNGDKELELFLSRFMAYLVSGIKTEQKFYILKSSGNSGKSTFINLISKLINEKFTANIPINKLDDRFSIAEAVGKKLIVAAENEGMENFKISTETLKKLTGNDLIRIERKYENSYSDKINVELLFATNSDNLLFSEVSQGLARRITIIETEGQVKEHIVDFQEKLEAEIPYIMRKLISSFKDVVNNGYKLPLCQSVIDASRNAINRGEVDKIGDEFYSFFQENLEFEAGAKVTKREIYRLYEQNGGKESTSKFWKRFDLWVEYRKNKIERTSPPNRGIVGLKLIKDISLEDII